MRGARVQIQVQIQQVWDGAWGSQFLTTSSPVLQTPTVSPLRSGQQWLRPLSVVALQKEKVEQEKEKS